MLLEPGIALLGVMPMSTESTSNAMGGRSGNITTMLWVASHMVDLVQLHMVWFVQLCLVCFVQLEQPGLILLACT